MFHESFPAISSTNDHVALVDGDKQFSYSQVDEFINRFAAGLLGNKKDLQEERIAFFIPASVDYVTVMHGIWRAGGIAVPLNVASAVSELDHYLSCAGVSRLIVDPDYRSDELELLCRTLNIELHTVAEVTASIASDLPDVDLSRRAMMLFTSGTTNKPKGVVHTHRSIRAQITCLLDAWCWSEDDVIPLFLPVHHIHGIINILS